MSHGLPDPSRRIICSRTSGYPNPSALSMHTFSFLLVLSSRAHIVVYVVLLALYLGLVGFCTRYGPDMLWDGSIYLTWPQLVWTGWVVRQQPVQAVTWCQGSFGTLCGTIFPFFLNECINIDMIIVSLYIYLHLDG